MDPATAAIHRAAVARILMDKRFSERARWINVWNYVLTTELKLGTQFLRGEPGGQLYAVLGDGHRIVSLPRAGRGDDWHAYFQQTYGFGEREKLSRFIYDALRSHVGELGTRVELRRFASYNSTTKTAYLTGYNGTLFKIAGSGSNTTIEPQGEDGVFFADDDGGVPARQIEIKNHGILLDRLTSPNFAVTTPSGITPEQQQKALTIWMFALAFPDLLPTKPILLLEGTRGAGKTSAIVLIQLALMGVKRPIIMQQNKEDDFGVVLLKQPIALFDNQDSYIEWLPNAICSYCTSGVWTKRKLYSDDESLTIKPHAFIAVSSRNPASYRRDDVTDRCVILRLERRSKFTRASQLDESILLDRGKLLGEYLWWIGKIVDELRKAEPTTDSDHETHRMADFAAFGRVVARVLGWSEEELNALMDALQAERDAFLNEEDPLVELLHKWIRHPNGGRYSNVGRLISVFDLHAELVTLAGDRPFKDVPRTLGQKMRSSFVERDFIVQPEAVGKQKGFRIWRHSDPRLGIVGDAGDEGALKINE